MAQASAVKLEHTGPAEKNWKVRQTRLCQKEKEQSRLSRAPDSEGGESQGEREPHLGEREEDQSRSTEWKGWTSR